MQKEKKRLKNTFNKDYGRPFFWQTTDRYFFYFALILLITLTVLFSYKAQQYQFYDASKAKLPEQKLRSIFIDIAERQKIENPIRTPPLIVSRALQQEQLRQRIANRLQEQGLVYEGEVDTALLNSLKGETKIELASEDELDDILDGFIDAYRLDREKEFELSARAKAVLDIGPTFRVTELNTPVIRSLNTAFGDSVVIDEDRIHQGYRTKEELKEIDRTIINQESLYKTCMIRLKRFYPEKSFFFKIKFKIDSLGKLKKESVKITDHNITDLTVIDCILKRTKFLRGFKKAARPRAADYIFRKKYVF